VAQAECPPVVGVCAGLAEASCEAAVEVTCNANAVAAQRQGRTFQSNAVSACVSALDSVFSALSGTLEVRWQALNGTCGTTAPCAGSPNDICAQVFQGSTPSDDPCTSTYECTPGNVCGSAGACGPEADKQLNEGCADNGDVCEPGTVCSLEPGQKAAVCTMGMGVGDTCSDNLPCASTAECKAGRCVALGEEGSTCASNADCDPTAAMGSFCDTNVSKPICTLGYTFGTEAPDCSAFGGTK